MKGQKPLKIMFSAGEPSGDLHGARLAEAIREISPETELIGFGGDKMRDAGVRLVEHLKEYSVMGIWAVLKNLGKILRLMSLLTETMKKEKPDVLVIIDYPDFNWRLAKKARALGIKVFSYSPPSAWAWRKGRAKKCGALADELCALYPFETPVYEKAGANIKFLGNPLVDTVVPNLTEEEGRRFFGITADMRPVLLLPGSRSHEIELLLPVMLGAAVKLVAAKPQTHFFLPVAQGRSESEMQPLVDKFGLRDKITFTHEHTYDLMGLAEFAVATSGTVVMEAALRNLPCVVLYRFGALAAFIGRLVVHIDNFSLPNILLGEKLQTELLQDDVNPEKIFAEAMLLYKDGERHDYVKSRLRDAVAKLGAPGAAGRIAAEIVACAANK